MDELNLNEVLGSAIYAVYYHFRNFVERTDLESVGRIWLYDHPLRVTEYLEDANRYRGRYRLRRDLMMCMEKFARAERAHKLGYKPEDEFFYSAALVGALLPSVVLGSWQTPGSELGGPRGSQDPSEGGSWQASRADVAQAWQRARLTKQQNDVMIEYHVRGFTQEEIATARGITQGQVSKTLKSGMRRVIKELGGSRPRDCPYECECHAAPLRRRPGVNSNTSGTNQAIS